MISSRASRFSSRKLEEHEVGRAHFPIRRKNVGVANLLDVRVEPQWDWYSVALNTATVLQTMFTIPIGQSYTPTGGAAVTKNLWHTSLVFQSQLDSPRKLLVKCISLINDPRMSSPDINQLAYNFMISFLVSGKMFWNGHASKIPGGGGPYQSGTVLPSATPATVTGGAVYTSAANGLPTARNYSPLVDDSQAPVDNAGNIMPKITGVLIESGQRFNVIADPTLQGAGTGFTASNLTVAANGILSVGVSFHVYLEGITFAAVV